MKKTFKVLSLLLIMALVSISLVGCTSDELSVYNAMLKSQSIESMEAKTTVSFDFSATGLSEEYDADIQMLAQSLNDLKLVLNQKYQLQDMKNLVSKAQIDGIINLSGTAMDFSLWVDTNFSDENPILKEIIKLPPMVSMLLPQEFSGKQYIVLDLNKMPEDLLPNPVINTSVSSSVSTDIQALTTEFYENYIKKLNPGMTLFKKNGTEVIDGASAAVYEMNMDDAAFKALIKYLGNDFFTNAESRTLIKNYFIAIYDLMAEISPMYGMVSDEFEKGFAELEANLDKSHESFNKFMDIMNDVKIVGDKGFTLKYSINPDGYIVKETSYIDLVIDLEKWTAAGAELETAFGGIKTQEEAKAVQVQEEPIAEPAAIEPAEASLPAQTAEEASSETPEEADFSTSYAVTSAIPSGIINLGIEYETVLSNINGQVEIEFPELTEENSIDYFEMLKQMMSSVQNNTSTISVYVNDSKVQFMNDPIIRNGRTLAPAREVFESLNGDVQWDDTNRTVKAVIGDTKIDLTIDSNEAFVNGVLHVLDEPASIIDDRTYVPVRFLAESIGGQVEWYPEAMTVFIVK